MSYFFEQWLFFFYIYCFIGWLWETCYVSVLQGKWVNRGFMQGPFLPLYGSGAIIVLVFTLPVRTNAAAVFLIGMVSATVLEYVTGVVMEKLFHVRYWDYTNQPFNLNGHICLSSSLAWGIFSMILTMYAHTPIERFVLHMNRNVLEVLIFFLTIIISIDMFESVREALDLKEMLLNLEENNAEFKRLSKHIEIMQAFYGTELKEKSEAGLRKLSTAIESGKELYNTMEARYILKRRDKRYARLRSLLKRNPHAVSKMHEQAFREFLHMKAEEENKKNEEAEI